MSKGVDDNAGWGVEVLSAESLLVLPVAEEGGVLLLLVRANAWFWKKNQNTENIPSLKYL